MNSELKTGCFALICVLCAVMAPAVAAEEESSTNDRIVEEPPSDRDEALDLFTRKIIWSGSIPALEIEDFGRTVSPGTDVVFFQGRHKEPLEGAEFYETVGRGDLANSYRRASIVRSGLALMSLVGVAGGLGLTLRGVSRPELWQIYTGGGLFFGGLLSSFIAPRIEPHPMSPHERREIAEDYNLRLLDELEIDEDDLPEEEEDRLQVENIGLDFFVGPNPNTGNTGGGLIFSGQF